MKYNKLKINCKLITDSPNSLDDNDDVNNFFLVNGERFLFYEYRLINQDVLYIQFKAILVDFIIEYYNHNNKSDKLEKIIGDIVVKGNSKNLIVKYICEYYYESFIDEINNICNWKNLPVYDSIDYPKTYLIYRLVILKHYIKYINN